MYGEKASEKWVEVLGVWREAGEKVASVGVCSESGEKAASVGVWEKMVSVLLCGYDC